MSCYAKHPDKPGVECWHGPGHRGDHGKEDKSWPNLDDPYQIELKRRADENERLREYWQCEMRARAECLMAIERLRAERAECITLLERIFEEHEKAPDYWDRPLEEIAGSAVALLAKLRGQP